MKKLMMAAAATALLAGCEQPADVASKNLSRAADNFEVPRKITVVNGITGDHAMVMTGYCSLGNDNTAREMSITCKTESGEFLKNFITLGDNVFVLTEQLADVDVSTFHYRLVFRPQAIIPDIDLQGDASELIKNRN